MQNYVFVIDTELQPLNSVTPRRARELLTKGKAAVFRKYPFTVILKHAVIDPNPRPLTIKLDPGSKTTGIALLDGDNVIWCAELEHRGYQIEQSLEERKSLRRGRRNRKTRYREPQKHEWSRKGNKKPVPKHRREGWLSPSLMHRVLTVQTWVKRLCRYAPIANIASELVKFDTQAMQNPEVNGVEYQQGELAGYEVREYLLEKWGRKCAYCDAIDVPLQIEHIHPRAKGGSNRVSNLTLSCEKCNLKKGTKSIDEFLKKDCTRLETIKRHAKAPLKDAAAVNSTRWKLYHTLKKMLPTTTGTGGQTKFNRTRLGFEKQHWVDAACVGDVGTIKLLTNQPLRIKAAGWGTRQMCGTDKYGFPTRHRGRKQVHFGFRTGDIVKAVVPERKSRKRGSLDTTLTSENTNQPTQKAAPFSKSKLEEKGKKIGKYVGRVLCRKSGSFDISTKSGRVSGISYKCCTHIHKKDGYSYAF
jgi:5-methylcytosine-specific restriction endonuclease McrA